MFFFLALACIELSGVLLDRSNSWRWSRIVISLLLFDRIHVVYTYVMLLRVPEFRGWMREWGGGSERIAQAKILGVLLAVFFFFFKLPAALAPLVAPATTTSLQIIFFIAFADFHANSQFYGVARLYEKKIPGAVVPRAFKLNRFCFIMIFLLTFTSLVSRQFFPSDRIILATTIFGLLISAFIIGSSFFRCRENASLQPIYLIRVALLPLRTISAFAGLGVAALHALEYVYLEKKMRSRSIASNSRELSWLFAGAALFAMITAIPLRSNFGPELRAIFPDYKSLISALGALGSALSVGHFWLDGIIFRMRDEKTKKWIAPLVLDEEPRREMETPSFRPIAIPTRAENTAREVA